MKILHVIPYFTTAHGGPVNVVKNITKNLSKRGHDVTIMTTDVSMPGEKEEIINIDSSVDLKIFPCWNNWMAYHLKLHFSPEMNRSIAKSISDFDVVHLHEWRGIPNMYVFKHAKAAKAPIVIQPHGSSPVMIGPQSRSTTIIKKIYDNFYGNNLVMMASRIIALNLNEARTLKQQSVPDRKLVVIPNGLDANDIISLPKRGLFRERYGISADKQIILFLARFNPNKGADLLIRAFSHLHLPDVILVMVGPDDGHLKEAKTLARCLGNDVIFTGPLTGFDKWSAYVDCDVYVLPSVYEAFGITVIEALACSRPVIVMESCGISDIIEDIGIVIKRDEVALSEALKELLSHPNMREEMGFRGRELILNNFTWDHIIPQYESLYLDCINKIDNPSIIGSNLPFKHKAI